MCEGSFVLGGTNKCNARFVAVLQRKKGLCLIWQLGLFVIMLSPLPRAFRWNACSYSNLISVFTVKELHVQVVYI